MTDDDLTAPAERTGVIRVNRIGSTVRVHRDGLTDIMDYSTASRLLAGLEVALAAALREAGRGKCLRCGRVASTVYVTPSGMTPHEEIMCGWCGGVLSPVLSPSAREGA